ncbi:ParB/RepB/Spo0J family partition protein [Brevibacterium sp. CT2-23B]|uniref:ParB/RepB/Spo0J family partition protein n=1 Tax=Brevibacterium sp. CT2-23B TaxID=2729630 RepID=UPI0034648854
MSAAPKKTTRKTSSPDAVSDAATGSADVETAAASSSGESTSVQVADNEAVDTSSDLVNDSQVPEATSAAASASSAEDDVRETHPGVYTSSGRSHADNEADEEGQSGLSGVDEDVATMNVVESEAMEAQDERRPAAASESEPSTGSESDNPKSSSASLEQSGDSDTVETADEGDLDDFEGVESIPDTEFGEIDVDLIDANPRQPRTVFDEDLLAELVHSIREIGVLQPVVVRQKPSDRSRFELIMGERRLRATKDAGLSTIPTIIRYVEDTDLLRDALLENLHRAELNPLEEAAAYGQLLEDFGCTQEELSERIGRSRPQISNTLRLLRLPPLVQRRVAAGVISAGHARAILGLRDPEHMEVLAQRIVAEGLSVRASEEAVVLLNRGDSINVSRATTKVSPEFLAVAERLGDRLDTKVNISVGKRKGKLSVEFANQEDLDRILGLLGISNEGAL